MKAGQKIYHKKGQGQKIKKVICLYSVRILVFLAYIPKDVGSGIPKVCLSNISRLVDSLTTTRLSTPQGEQGFRFLALDLLSSLKVIIFLQ